MNSIKAFVSRQLGQPSGWFGRLLMRLLNRENAGMNQLALSYLALQRGDRVLEIGFGGGYLLKQLLQSQLTSSVTGLDPSLDVLKLGEKRFRSHIKQGQLVLHQGCAEDLPFEAEAFDKVVTVNTLYFWTDVATVLHQCRHILRPGGSLVVCFNSADFLRSHQLDRYGFKGYQVEDVELLFEEAGFDLVQTISEDSANNGRFFCTRGTAG